MNDNFVAILNQRWKDRYDNNNGQLIIDKIRMWHLAVQTLKDQDHKILAKQLKNQTLIPLYKVAPKPSGAQNRKRKAVANALQLLRNDYREEANEHGIDEDVIPRTLDQYDLAKISIGTLINEAKLIMDEDNLDKIILEDDDIANLEPIFMQLQSDFELLYTKIHDDHSILVLLGDLQRFMLKLCKKVGMRPKWSSEYILRYTTGHREIQSHLLKRSTNSK